MWQSGLVVRGDGRGKQLGFPTANIELKSLSERPAEGIHACWVRISSQMYKGVMHVGPRPTFPGASETVEIHILNFSGDLYNTHIEFWPVKKLREIKKFSTIEELVQAMHTDCKHALSFLRTPPSL